MDLKKAIKSRGWTIEKLATQLTNQQGGIGVSQPSASQLVNGNPSLKKLEEIANIIGVPLWELLKDDEDTSQKVICPHCGKEINVSISCDIKLGTKD